VNFPCLLAVTALLGGVLGNAAASHRYLLALIMFAALSLLFLGRYLEEKP
jgi:hypothetical protein